ncbi:hypothetical protein BN439_3245 [Erwinia amylovora Ea644]|nr:hypothetical protein BN439_3245 [Erwinia amylovora Ea644]CCP08356.1 hypothetical protein BN440_3352 [Erwinia amylovora MR1]
MIPVVSILLKNGMIARRAIVIRRRIDKRYPGYLFSDLKSTTKMI